MLESRTALYRIALSTVAMLEGADYGLDPKFDEARRYIHRIGGFVVGSRRSVNGSQGRFGQIDRAARAWAVHAHSKPIAT
jgi:hypothetical protein